MAALQHIKDADANTTTLKLLTNDGTGMQTAVTINSDGDVSMGTLSINNSNITDSSGSISVGDNYFHAKNIKTSNLYNNTWTQIGSNIVHQDTGDFDGSSLDINEDGSIVAIGAKSNDDNGNDSGHVRVFKWNGMSWSQMGNDIDGESAGDFSGFSLSLNDYGNIVAIGAIGSNGFSGHVRVFKWNGSSWSQLGSDIDGKQAGDYSGYSVSLSSNGNIVAIGAYLNDDNGSDSGHVRVYQYIGNSWSQLGSDIQGKAEDDYSGWSVSLSADGKIVAIGSTDNDDNGSNSGHVRVYQYKGSSWTQLGSDIQGEAQDDYSGYSVSLSANGKIIAIGAPYNDGNGSNSGHVKVYKYEDGSWVQLGSDIDGEAIGDNSGYYVSLSANGNIVAIGAPGNAGNIGHVRIYKYDGSGWVQLGNDIDGDAVNNESGYRLALSANGNIVAISYILSDGYVKIYGLGEYISSLNVETLGINDEAPISELSVAGKIAITSIQGSTPTAPTDANHGWLYTKSDGKIYWQSNGLSETDLTGTGTVSASSGTFGTLSLGAGSITDSSGAISFVDENLSTTGTIDCGAITSTGDMTIYDDNNNADTSLSIGTSANEALVIQVLNGDANKTTEEIKFISKTASTTDNHGKMTFSVDENNILEINDSGITVTGTINGDVTGNTSGSSGSCTGNAATATEATNITAVANNSTDETVYLTFVDGATGTQGIETDTGLTYNPFSGILTATNFTGALTGNAATATEATNITAVANDSRDETVYLTFVDGATGTQGIETDIGLTYNPSSGILTATNFTGALTGNASGSSGSCTGNAATATVATTITVADTTDTTCSVALFESATGNLGAKSDGGLTYNADTGMLTATGFTSNGGDISYSNGQNATLSVAVTGSGTAGKDLTISAGSTTAASGNTDGGDLILKSGLGDGTGSSIIGFHTSTATSDDAVAERMRIHTNGTVGIGTTTPSFPLHVVGVTSSTVGGNYYLDSADGSILFASSFGNVSIRASNAIVGSFVVSQSDSRIKKDIVEITDDECLSKVRLLKPCKYKYIDEISKGSDDVYGFIAQEVQEVLSYAVKEQEKSEAIPNVYKGGVYTNGTIVLSEAHGLTENGNIKLKIKSNAIDITCPYTIVNETTLNIDTTNLSENNTPTNDPLYDEDGNQLPYNIFVYGTEVNDFHLIRKDAIWTTGISALQEVDRQLQAEKVKTATLETQVADLLARVTALENI